MDSTNLTIALGAGLVLMSVLSIMMSQRFGVPILLVFLVIGMLAGVDGPGGISYSDFHLTYLAGSIALVLILLDGGLNTPGASLKLAVLPAMLMSSLGVAITAGITAAGSHYFLNIDWHMALLLGAIVASTDAAAVFFLLRQHGIALSPKLKSTLEIESGMNDPAAVLLVSLFAQLAVGGQPISTASGIAHFVYALVAGAVIGAGGARAIIYVMRHSRLANGLYPIMVISAALFLFGITQAVGASGFLAAYVMGMTLRTMKHDVMKHVNNFSNGTAWICQILMFLMLGLLAAPHAMVPHMKIAFVIAGILMFAARPLASLICLAPFRYSWREILFVSWVGLRGAVPIYLATFPVLMGIKDSGALFSVVFVVVLLSLTLQGWSVPLVARLLKLSRHRDTHGAREDDLPAQHSH